MSAGTRKEKQRKGKERKRGGLQVGPNLVGEEDVVSYGVGLHAKHEANRDDRLEVAHDASS